MYSMEIVITGQIVCSLSLSRSVNFVPIQYFGGILSWGMIMKWWLGLVPWGDWHPVMWDGLPIKMG